ncbi:MAG: HAMP domain-containing histidine kinase [Lachnospiraceae bacterium]|nr:HAMP domain-containing histidine kinase [Lachnospiraceae bacterium]
MSYGFIAFLFLGFEHDTAISMLWMIPPMLIVYAVAIKLLIKGVEKRMGTLLEAIDKVSEGDLSTRIDLKDAEEYEQVYIQFNNMVSELSKTKEEMEAFTNEFAHEFKTPITSIKGFAELLEDTGKDIETEERMEYLGLIRSQAERLMALSQNTLLLSKVEATQVVVGKEHYDLAEQIRKCAIMLSRQMDEKNIEFDMSEDLSVDYYGNREMLEHVWINLLNNSLKFTPSRGIISVRITDQAEGLRVELSDTGIGMDEETQKHIFDKYYQNDTINLAKGSGIGLSIVHGIINLAGGSIEVKSALNEGSTFIIFLPQK